MVPRAIWGFWLENKFYQAHKEVIEWISIDSTLEMMGHDLRLTMEWKNLQPFQRLVNRGDPFPHENELASNLIPLGIIYMDDNLSWNLLGLNLNLSKIDKEPYLQPNLNPFQIASKKAWHQMMQLQEF